MGDKKLKDSKKSKFKLSAIEKQSHKFVQDHEDQRLSIPFIIGQFIAIFAISIFIGLLLLHLSLVWRRYQYGDSELLYKRSMEEMMNSYYGFDVYDPPSRVDLRVNTSIFVM